MSNREVLLISYSSRLRFCSVVVITPDFDSSMNSGDPSSNLGKTFIAELISFLAFGAFFSARFWLRGGQGNHDATILPIVLGLDQTT